MKKNSTNGIDRYWYVLRKALFAMKLTTFIFLISTLSLLAGQSYSQETRISLNMKNVQIKDVLLKIENSSEFFFIYNNQLIDVDRNVSINVSNEKISDVLHDVFQDQQVDFQLTDRKIVIVPISTSERQAQSKVTGRVTDSSKGSLPGVSVVIKGTTNGTITDFDGNYSLNNVPANATLQFSFVGMKMQEVVVGSQSNINVSLIEESIGIEEVVAVGYGSQSKTRTATAISNIKTEKIKGLPVTNASQALVGQIAGVRLQQMSGEPGAAPVIRIRGNGSLTSSNSPLYVIDGFPTDDASLFNSINPNDIASIDVLKDAASAAIYGSRAGNGVILVTTKKGEYGKARFTANLTTGFEQVSKRYDMAGPELFVEVAKEAYTNQGKPIPAILNDPSQWKITDWQDVIFRNAPFQNYQLGASGGTDKFKFNISAGYLDQQGIIINSFMRRYSLRAAFDAKLAEKVKVGVTFAPSYEYSRAQNTKGGNTSTGTDGILADALTMPPILPVRRDNGDYFVIVQDPVLKSVFNDQLSNVLNKLDANEDYTKAFRQVANAFISVEPINGLVLQTTINTGIVTSQREMYREAFLARGNGNTGNISTPNLAQITAQRTNATNVNWYWSNTATYTKTFKNKHDITALVGYDLSNQYNYFLQADPRTDKDNPVAFTNTTIKNIQGATLTTATTGKDEYVFDAVFSRLNYSFDRKYLISASVRRDRSSRFGPNSRAGIFPSFAAAWNVSEEGFMHGLESLSYLKVRTSYGETGNDRLTGSYPWIATLTKNYTDFGVGATDARALSYGPSGFSNPDLGWEKNKQTDIGIDLGLFKDRIGFALDWYERNSNTILSSSIPAINGKATTAIQNVGNVRNRGVEISLNTKNMTGALKWNTDFNISFNRNKITELSEGMTRFGSGNVYIRNYLGRPMGDIYAYIVEGTFNTPEDLVKYPKYGTEDVGDLRYRDVSGPEGKPDGKITADDMTRVGNYQPNFVYGLTNTLSYKNFDFSLLLDGSYGGQIVNSWELGLALNRYLENTVTRVAENRWRSAENPGNGYSHKAGTNNLSSDIISSTRYVFDSDYLRIRNITLGYSLPNALSHRLMVESLRVYFTVENLYTFTNYPGWNPEGSTNGDSATSNGQDTGAYPLSRNFSFGLNLSF